MTVFYRYVWALLICIMLDYVFNFLIILGAMMFQYYIKVIPTSLVELGGKELKTNQYSVTRYQKVYVNITNNYINW